MTAPAVEATFHVVACAGGAGTRVESRPARPPARDELVLKLRVAGLCGTDLFKLDSGQLPAGSVLGHELVGEVAAAGAEVTGFGPGDRVVVPHHVACGRCRFCRSGSETMCPEFKRNLLDPGGFAERVLVRPPAVQRAARRLPDSLSDEAAVFLEPAACVLRGIRRAGLLEDGVAAILGGGSMGLLHLLVLKAARPRVSVVVLEPMAERRKLALILGASEAREPGGDRHGRAFPQRGQHGADAVFDTVGGAHALRTGLKLCREGGSVVLFAHAREDERADFPLNALFKHERRLVASYSGGLEDQAAVFDMLQSGALDPAPLVTHRLPLDQFERGVALARRRRALKVVFTPLA